MAYKVLSNLRHDGEDYTAGDTLTAISDSEATILVNDGIIEPVTQAQVAQPAPQAPEDAPAPQQAPAPAAAAAPSAPTTPAPTPAPQAPSQDLGL